VSQGLPFDCDLVLVAQEGCVMWNGLSQQYERMSLQDQSTFDRWISANAIFGAVLALGILAMAVAGFHAPGPEPTPLDREGLELRNPRAGHVFEMS
jgi:hypothetical protein